jgi:glycosyltransferase involved in cell wall biosynthesis
MAIKFSLLVPSYNRPEMIRETVESLLVNAAPDVEIIVSDDASPRRSEIRTALSDLIRDRRVSFHQQEANLQWSNNRNALVEAAHGEYVVLLGDDDRLKPAAVERLRHWTSRFPRVEIFGFGYDVIDEIGKRAFTYCTPKPVQYKIAEGDSWRELFTFDAVPMWSHHPFTMCSKRSTSLRFPYDPVADIGDDALYVYQALASGCTFLTIPEVLFEWRNMLLMTTEYTNLSGSPSRCMAARASILLVLLKDPRLPVEVRDLLKSRLFLERFLHLRGPELARVHQEISERRLDVVALSKILANGDCGSRQKWQQKVHRHLRAVRVMGPRHLIQVVCYFRDKRRLQTSRARAQVVQLTSC